MTKIKYEQIDNEDIKDIKNPVLLSATTTQLMQFIVLCTIILCLHLLYMKSTYDFTQVYYESVSADIVLVTHQSATTSTATPRHANISNANHIAPLLNTTSQLQTPDNYYVFTSKCRMPRVDPFTAAARKIFHPKSYAECTKDEAFISPIYSLNTQRYTLHMNAPIIEKYAKAKNFSAEDVSCCYRQIVRAGSGGNVDKSFTLLKCTIFHQDFTVPQHIDYMITECHVNSSKNAIQQDAFSFVQYRNLTKSSNTTSSPASSFKNKNNINAEMRKPSILMLGIDSLSRINLRRTMPKTFKYLQISNWFELQGYNKMGDNTFPNLMALLSSYNMSTAYSKCQPKTVGGMDKPQCNLIWRNFREFGYRTAYAEDASVLSTFNYLKKGFAKPPTDYYLRPMTLAIERNMKVVKNAGLPFCVGRKHYAEYIYDYALQFANVYQDEPIFGFFWANTFSHNSYDTPATMDVKMLQYLLTMERDGILNRAIVFFFSDHGMRWGPLLKLREGFLEERLPMMFLSLPGWYRDEHPDFVKALQINRNRLTSPFDIYATLKAILEMSDNERRFPALNDTTTGLSIFKEIPENRACIDAGIIDHWCTCVAYQSLAAKDKTVQKVSGLIIDEMNAYLTGKNFSGICRKLKLNKINEAKQRLEEPGTHSNSTIYTISYSVLPGKNDFQATAHYDIKNHTISINVEDISRLDLYANTSKCIDDKEAKKYCICNNTNIDKTKN